jgi:hypothetical protein
MTSQKAFLYFLKVYGLYPEDKISNERTIYLNKFDMSHDNWTFLYVSGLKEQEYKMVKNNEFKIRKLYDTTLQELSDAQYKFNQNNKIFKEKFVQVLPATLGEYNFSLNSFPLKFNNYFNLIRISSAVREDFQLRIEQIVNANEFNYQLPMSQNQADEFINRRQVNTRIDRTVWIKMTYSIVNSKLNRTTSYAPLKGYVYSYEIFDDQNLSKKIGTLLPRNDWDDPENEVKIGQKTIDEGVMQEYFLKHGIHPKRSKSGLFYEISDSGTRPLKKGESVRLLFTIKKINGDVFYSNFQDPFPRFDVVVPYGDFRLNEGITEGMSYLGAGGSASLYIPSNLGYGRVGEKFTIQRSGVDNTYSVDPNTCLIAIIMVIKDPE